MKIHYSTPNKLNKHDMLILTVQNVWSTFEVDETCEMLERSLASNWT